MGEYEVGDEGERMTQEMTIGIGDFVRQYRNLKSQIDELKVTMNDLKKKYIEPMVDEHGDWKDDKGYARRIMRNDSISYDDKLDGVAHAWASSTDPTIKMCGDVVLTHRRVKRGSSYIQIK